MDNAKVTLLTVEQAAEALGISRAKLYQIIAARQITTVVFGRNRRISAEALQEFVEAHTEIRREGDS